uniref:Retrotransposon gag domain-containing protein n=1 Tax=Chenopodium quinoa TaxID=63459 RepID=A0A803MU44_CHEQI
MVEPPAKMLREYAMPDASSTSASIVNGVSEDAIRLRLFSFSLRDKARKWSSSKSSDPFTTWTSLSQAFLNKFFPLGKTAKLRNDITNFTQNDLESFYDESWERSTIDAAAGGALMSKTTEEANKLLEELAFNNYSCSSERSIAKKSTRMYDVDGINMLNAKLGQLANAINSRNQGSLPSKTEVNPKEQCKVVTLRSGKTLDDITVEAKAKEVIDENAEIEPEKQPKLEGTSHNDDVEVLEIANAIEACPPWKKREFNEDGELDTSILIEEKRVTLLLAIIST